MLILSLKEMGDIMNEQNTRNQFIVIKLLICLSVILYSISNEVKPFWSIGLEWLLVAVFVFVTIGLELQESKKWIWLSLSLLVIAIMAYYNGLERLHLGLSLYILIV